MFCLPGACVDVAVDHRLQRLTAPIPSQKNSPRGNHGNLLRKLARSIKRPKEVISPEEIDFTIWLSQPASMGGAMVMLQQPTNSHPYHLGREVTFQSCDTLVAIDECFRFASLGSLGIEGVTVIDDLPYTRKNDATTPEYRQGVRSHVNGIIVAKSPSVVLCKSQESERTPSPTAQLKSLGVGQTFGEPLVHLGTDRYTRRINAFHPSYALYHRSTESAFRQLLLLEVARTCGELRGDWREEEWMHDLRRHCRKKAQQQNFGVRQQLGSSLHAVESLLIDLASRNSDSTSAIYQLLTNSRASEHCNDVSLCLRDIDATYEAIHPDDRDDDLVSLAAFTMSKCKEFLMRVLRGIKGTQLLLVNRKDQVPGLYTEESVLSVTRTSSAGLAGRMQLRSDVHLFLQKLNGSFAYTHARTTLRATIGELSRLFLSLAIAFEAQLRRLMLARSGIQITDASAERELGLAFSHLGIH